MAARFNERETLTLTDGLNTSLVKARGLVPCKPVVTYTTNEPLFREGGSVPFFLRASDIKWLGYPGSRCERG